MAAERVVNADSCRFTLARFLSAELGLNLFVSQPAVGSGG